MAKILKKDGKTIIQAEPRLDAINASAFENDIKDAISVPGAQVEMDCTNLTYMASSGLRVVQKMMRTVNTNNGSFKMTNVAPQVYKVLSMTGFTKFIRVEQRQ